MMKALSAVVLLMSVSLGYIAGAFAQSDFQPYVNGGEKVSSQDPIAQSTVMLETDSEYCSATIIGEGLLLTAAHCIGNSDNWVLIHFEGLESKVERKADRFLRHEGYRDMNGDDSINDVALIFFSGGLPQGFKAAEILPEDQTLKVGEELQLAGYGNGSPLGELSKVTLTISAFLTNNTLIKFSQTAKRGICHGDSGGPAYKFMNGKIFLAGLAAYANEMDCSGFSVYTKATPYKDWIQKQQKK
jgi:secreted trypsin-like serine protease